MQRDYIRWYSPSLGRDMEQLVFGHAGAPVLIFPTSMGRFYENEDMGLIGYLADKIESGFIQVYCVDSVDAQSWYNWGASPEWRVGHHMAYDSYLFNEVLPFIGSRNSNGYLIAAGCSFGAYHAVNFGFRHPQQVHRVIGLSGRYNMYSYVRGYEGQDLYYNSPLSFIGGLQDGEYKNQLQRQEIKLLTGAQDLAVCQAETRALHDTLNSKGIGNTFESWNDTGHDWPYWGRQIRNFI